MGLWRLNNGFFGGFSYEKSMGNEFLTIGRKKMG
jgi:hypothetical protein